MKIVQMVPTLSFGDGVGNDIVAIDAFLKKEGYDTCIYAIDIDKRLEHLAKRFDKLPELDKNDIAIYHYAIGSAISAKLSDLKCKRVLRYHNVTPAHFFRGYDVCTINGCREGRKQIKEIMGEIDYGIPVSNYNMSELYEMGYKCPMYPVPILIPFDDYRKTPDKDTINKYSDGKTNIVFAGRIVPNKKQQDLISTFYYYKKYYNNNSRLILVGNYNEEDQFYKELVAYIDELGLVDDVVFTGHISFPSILACFNVADVFLCLSEHEGFCIPIVEAMVFNKPIIAYDSSAVGDTLGRHNLVLPNKNPLEVAGVVDYVVKNKNGIREKMLAGQAQQLELYQPELVQQQFMDALNKIGC